MKLSCICVFCASSSQIKNVYLESAYELGKILALNNSEVIYGGGSIGSMGALADGVLNNNGRLVGVIPQFMMKLEWGNPNVSEMIVVNTMAERKELLIKNADAVVVLPGGTGTLEEMAEVISLKKLGLFSKPIVILNTEGFYDHFFNFLDKMIEDNFVRPEHKSLYSIALMPDDVLPAIKSAPAWGEETIKLAAI